MLIKQQLTGDGGVTSLKQEDIQALIEMVNPKNFSLDYDDSNP